MRGLSMISGWLGVLVFLIAIAGRFYQEPTITVGGYTFKAVSFMVLANSLLLISIFLHLRSNKRSA